MKTILFAWELGGGFGHLTRDLALARQCTAAGYRCVFAVSNTRTAQRVFGSEFEFFQAPMSSWKAPAAPITCHADLMSNAGYGDFDSLAGLVNAWLQLLRLAGVQLVLADHAPVVLLAARLISIPALALGTGFEVPPPTDPFPPFNLTAHSVAEAGREHSAHARALANANRLLEQNGKPHLHALATLYEKQSTLLLTSPALDHYGARSPDQYLGTPSLSLANTEVQWDGLRPTRIFGYLRRDTPDLDELLGALAQDRAIEALVVIPDMPIAEAKARSGVNLRVVPTILDVDVLLTSVTLVICNGGHGLMARCAETATRVLVLPVVVEQLILAKRLSSAYSHIVIKPRGLPLRETGLLLQHCMARPVAREITHQCVSFSAAQVQQRIATALG